MNLLGNFLNLFAFFARQAHHITQQRSQPAQAAEQVGVDQSAITHASRQSWLEPACRRVSIQLAVFTKTNQEIEICPAYKYMQPFTEQLSWCDVACTPPLYTALSIRPFYFVHACGVRVAFVDHVELLAFASRQCAPRTTDLSVRFIHSHSVQFFLVNERSGRRTEAARGAKRLVCTRWYHTLTQHSHVPQLLYSSTWYIYVYHARS